ncbi:Macrophage migration inhibitory factor-like [Pseudocercospora fuligena]|uniref:L-dopachrome isomerase n=1 Tax=Pseudocercospora fuligena TaxID=685502 RepID=A0A8H6VJZ1_9PEZI|nr:Macrophage migration inhibitory factor-like [Pseudocercospora fuligena]
MPHSTRGSADSNASTHSLEHVDLMPQKSSSQVGLALVSNGHSPQPLNLKRERSSLPGGDAYASLVGKTDLDEFLQKHLGDKDSMIAAYNNSSQQRKQYYEEQFQYKDNVQGGVRERVQRESPVIAELRTNVIIKDEFTLVTDLSYHLAARYTRPDSAIMVKVDHSACLAMGGTFDPCYILTVSTVPAQMGPTMNKRNAALIQSFMADILSVPPERGIVKFLAIPEECFATNGTTIAGEIERQEKQQSGANDSTIRRAITSTGRKSIPSFKKSFEARSGESKVTNSTDFKAAPGKGHNNAAGHSRETTPPAALSPVGVFELPAGDADKKRPATAHAQSSSSVSNGLRMNGVSSKNLSPRNSGTPKSRPRTVSGSSIQQQIKDSAAALASAPPPPAVRLSSVPSSKRDRPPSFLKVDPAASARPTTPRQRPSTASPEDRVRPRDGTADSAVEVPVAGDKNTEKKDVDEQDAKDKQGKKDPAANTAKRRSTITATPKIPDPPPTPSMNEDRKSTKSMRIGKRKSFLAAFRRSSATPAAG